ncbi:sulfite exporter TauE/SafE family protein, partial [Pseudoxanthomonas sp. KAs_5_3]
RAAARLDRLQLQRLVSLLLLSVGAWFAWLLLS